MIKHCVILISKFLSTRVMLDLTKKILYFLKVNKINVVNDIQKLIIVSNLRSLFLIIFRYYVFQTKISDLNF